MEQLNLYGPPWEQRHVTTALYLGDHYWERIKVSVYVAQHAKKVLSDCPGLVDFAIGLVNSVRNLPDRQVLCFGEIQITEGL